MLFSLVSCLRTKKAEDSQVLGEILDYDTGPFSLPFFLPVYMPLSESKAESKALYQMPHSTFIALPPQASKLKTLNTNHSNLDIAHQNCHCHSFSGEKRQPDSWHSLFSSQRKQKPNQNISSAALVRHWSHTTLQQPHYQVLTPTAPVFLLIAVLLEVLLLVFLKSSSQWKSQQCVEHTPTRAFLCYRGSLWPHTFLFKGTYLCQLQKLLALKSKETFKALF